FQHPTPVHHSGESARMHAKAWTPNNGLRCSRFSVSPAVFIFVIPAILLLLSGCAYTVGPVNGVIAREKSVQVNPFVNQTVEPHLTDAVTSQLRKRLQQDGTYRLATHGDGDIIVSGSITNYQRHELTFARSDTLTARDYRLMLTAQVTARERSSGKVIFDAPVSGFTLIRVGSDLVSTERQALPLLAQDLA